MVSKDYARAFCAGWNLIVVAAQNSGNFNREIGELEVHLDTLGIRLLQPLNTASDATDKGAWLYDSASYISGQLRGRRPELLVYFEAGFHLMLCIKDREFDRARSILEKIAIPRKLLDRPNSEFDLAWLNEIREFFDQVLLSPEDNWSDQLCFVLMPFELPWSNRVWDHVRTIAETSGFICKRADDLYGQDVLSDIRAAIVAARVIIADTSERNPNVFYEIGIAHTLEKQVILLTQNSKDIPFDFLRFRHLIYEDNVDGFKKIALQLPQFLSQVKIEC